MRPASVGFQCPECVSEGARATRAGRTAYGGLRSHNPALSSQILIGLNAAVWALILVTGGSTSRWLYTLGLHPVTFTAPVSGAGLEQFTGVSEGAYWQPLTSLFTHVTIWHIGFNMLALWFLGPQLEAAVGRLRFVGLYLLSGLCGSALAYWFAPINSLTIGASGAIFGLMGGLLVIALKVKADPRQLLVWIGLNFLITVVGRGFISWQGHLGGFIGGVLIGLVLAYAPRRGRAVWQIAGMGVLTIVLVAAYALRTVALGPLR